ncbi:MAG: hypothetical protein AAFW89_06310, partial [Bacteroidota bacterium]
MKFFVTHSLLEQADTHYCSITIKNCHGFKTAIISIIAVLALMSCESKSNHRALSVVTFSTEINTTKLIPNDSIVLKNFNNSINDLSSTESGITVLSKNEPFVYSLSITGEVMDSGYYYGRGPREVIGPWKVGYNEELDLPYILDIKLGKIEFLNTNEGSLKQKKFEDEDLFIIPSEMSRAKDIAFVDSTL